MEKGKKDEVMSRRGFFKKSVQVALPMLGVIALASNPAVAKVTEVAPAEEMGCNFGCENGCSSGCYTTCRMMCSGSCKGSCQGQCTGQCARSCSGGCSGSCKGYY